MKQRLMLKSSVHKTVVDFDAMKRLEAKNVKRLDKS